MRLIGRERLDQLKGRGAEVESWVRNWVAEVADAHWRRPEDVAEQFPSACHRGRGCFLFPIAQYPAVIQLEIAFAQGVALISDLDTNEVTYGS
jgi:mRNA-degrading endonuclease HigB of HigAB toxin-antitoxin module